MNALEILLSASLWAAAIRIASPLIFATLGELISERAGVLNLGIEGIMTVGAFAGWYTVYHGGDLWLGVVVAALAGSAFGLLHGVLVVPLGLSQHVTGIGITLFAASLTYYTYRLAFPEVTSPPKIEAFQPWAIPVLSDMPFFGEALFRQTPLTYLAFIAAGLVGWFLYRTPAGLAVRMAGENPAAVEAQGIDVTRVRIAAVVAGSALMGIGGAFLTLSAFLIEERPLEQERHAQFGQSIAQSRRQVRNGFVNEPQRFVVGSALFENIWPGRKRGKMIDDICYQSKSLTGFTEMVVTACRRKIGMFNADSAFGNKGRIVILSSPPVGLGGLRKITRHFKDLSRFE